MTNLKASTLRPGLLVSLKTSIRGGVSYAKRDLEVEGPVEQGIAKARWETERTIVDPKEHEASVKARSAARTAITKVCSASAFGLLCPSEKAEELDAAIAEARRIADAFNETASVTRVSVYVIAGRVAGDDVEAVKAISSEVRDLLEDMERGVKNMDVGAIRKAADSAKEVGAMLSDDMKVKVEVAIDAARLAARKIVTAGEAAATEINSKFVWQITAARTAFLDLDGQGQIAAPVEPGRAIDMTPSDGVAQSAPRAVAPALEV